MLHTALCSRPATRLLIESQTLMSTKSHGAFPPIHHLVSIAGNAIARVFAETGSWPGARRSNFGGLPGPLAGFAGSGETPGGQTVVAGRIPTA